jgi:hypothetical protein
MNSAQTILLGLATVVLLEAVVFGFFGIAFLWDRLLERRHRRSRRRYMDEEHFPSSMEELRGRQTEILHELHSIAKQQEQATFLWEALYSLSQDYLKRQETPEGRKHNEDINKLSKTLKEIFDLCRPTKNTWEEAPTTSRQPPQDK